MKASILLLMIIASLISCSGPQSAKPTEPALSPREIDQKKMAGKYSYTGDKVRGKIPKKYYAFEIYESTTYGIG